jgi:hypothetical protein
VIRRVNVRICAWLRVRCFDACLGRFPECGVSPFATGSLLSQAPASQITASLAAVIRGPSPRFAASRRALRRNLVNDAPCYAIILIIITAPTRTASRP